MPQTRKKRNRNKSKGLKGSVAEGEGERLNSVGESRRSLKRGKNKYKKSQKINRRKLRGGEVYESPETWNKALYAPRANPRHGLFTNIFSRVLRRATSNRKPIKYNKDVADELNRDVTEYSEKYKSKFNLLLLSPTDRSNILVSQGDNPVLNTNTKEEIQQKVKTAWVETQESEPLSFDPLNKLIERYLALDESSIKCGYKDDECRDSKENMYNDLYESGIELSKMLDDTYNDLYIDSIKGTKKKMEYMPNLIAKIFVYYDKSLIKSNRSREKGAEWRKKDDSKPWEPLPPVEI